MSTPNRVRTGYTRAHWFHLARTVNVEEIEKRGGYGYTQPPTAPSETLKRRDGRAPSNYRR